MPDALVGGLNAFTGLLGAGGNLASAFRDEPDQQFAQRPPFRGTITTPAFTFGGGTLARTGTDAFSTAGFADSLSGVRTGTDSLRGRIAALRPDIAQGLQGAQSLFGRTGALQSNITGLDTDLQGLQGEVRPGFGRLTESAARTIQNRASAASGNLRASLNKRKILGSSFANAQQASVARDFAELEEQTRAEALVAEITATRGIIQDRAGLVQLSGQLIQLSGQALQEQARFIALDLGANEQELQTFQQDVETIKTEMTAFRDQINRELTELNISTDFLRVVDQFLTDEGQRRLQDAASQISGGNFSSDQGDREASDSFNDDRDTRTGGIGQPDHRDPGGETGPGGVER
jgi:hypothetical protein